MAANKQGTIAFLMKSLSCFMSGNVANFPVSTLVFMTASADNKYHGKQVTES